MRLWGRRAEEPLVWNPVDAVLIQMVYPGIKVISRNRQTGTITSVMDNRVSYEVPCGEGERWGVVCDTHAVNVCSDTLAGAKVSQSYPTNFCEDCRDLFYEEVVLTPAEATSDRVETMIRDGREFVGDKYPVWREAGVTRARAALRKRGIKF
tara:strand:+ start:173 stop:628 length:456 start_codon:yes stop_codon:yes gene_type:complete